MKCESDSKEGPSELEIIPHASDSPKSLKIFVGGLSPEANDETLMKYFGQFGSILKCRGKKWKNDKNKCKGFAIVFVDDVATYERILSLNHKLLGRTIECKKAISNKSELMKHNQMVVNQKVFVTGLPLTTTDAELGEYFSAFGHVEMAYVVKRNGVNKKSRIGFVSFSNLQDKEKVLAIKNHKLGDNRVFVNDYHTKNELTKGESFCKSGGSGSQKHHQSPTSKPQKASLPNKHPPKILPKDHEAPVSHHRHSTPGGSDASDEELSKVFAHHGVYTSAPVKLHTHHTWFHPKTQPQFGFAYPPGKFEMLNQVRSPDGEYHLFASGRPHHDSPTHYPLPNMHEIPSHVDYQPNPPHYMPFAPSHYPHTGHYPQNSQSYQQPYGHKSPHSPPQNHPQGPYQSGSYQFGSGPHFQQQFNQK